MSKNKSTLESVLFFVFFYEIVSSFFGRRKKSKKVAGDNYCGYVPDPAALFSNCKAWPCRARNALRSTRKINARFIIAGTFVPDRPNKTAAGASPDLSGAGVFCAKMAGNAGVLRDFQSFFGINVDYVVNLLYNMRINIK